MPEYTTGLKGTADAIHAFAGTINELTMALARALKMEGELVMTDAKENYVPVATGVMRASGFVDEPVITDKHIEVVLGFGGASEPYALTQHENMVFFHRVGRNKFLEIPMLAAAAGLDQRVANYVRKTSSRLQGAGQK